MRLWRCVSRSRGSGTAARWRMAQAHARVRGQASARKNEVHSAAVTPGTAPVAAFAWRKPIVARFRIAFRMAPPAVRRAALSSVSLHVRDDICLARQPRDLVQASLPFQFNTFGTQAQMVCGACFARRRAIASRATATPFSCKRQDRYYTLEYISNALLTACLTGHRSQFVA